MKPDIDFSAPRTNKSAGGVLLLMAGILAVLYVWNLYGESTAAIQAAEERLTKARESALSKNTTRKSNAETRLEQLREIEAKLTFPWPGALRDLEQLDTDDVAVLGVEMDSQKRTMEIGAEARNVAAMIAYVEAFGKRGRFAGVKLLGHQIQRSDPDKPVRFALQARIAK